MFVLISRQLIYNIWKSISRNWKSLYSYLSRLKGRENIIDQELLVRMLMAVERMMLKKEPFPNDPDSLYWIMAKEY